MTKSIRDVSTKKRDRPFAGGRRLTQLVRMDEKLTAEIDSWRQRQDDHPTRPEAIRRLVELGLRTSLQAAVHVNEAESYAAQASNLAAELGLKMKTD